MVALGFAIDDAHVEREVVVGGVSAQHEFGKVHEDARVDVVIGQPAPALERVVDLLHAAAHGHVEGVERGLAELAVGDQAVALLELRHVVGEGLIVRARRNRGAGVAFEVETLLKLFERGIEASDGDGLGSSRQWRKRGRRAHPLLLREL